MLVEMDGQREGHGVFSIRQAVERYIVRSFPTVYELPGDPSAMGAPSVR
jgi:hypothetical protein